LKGQDELDGADQPQVKVSGEISFLPGGIRDPDEPVVSKADIAKEVWYFAHRNEKKQNAGRPVHAMSFGKEINGRDARPILTPGQKRLKRMICMVGVEEGIEMSLDDESILDKSICARRVRDYYRNTSAPLPGFLRDREGEPLASLNSEEFSSGLVSGRSNGA
jgi:hypothetical protein